MWKDRWAQLFSVKALRECKRADSPLSSAHEAMESDGKQRLPQSGPKTHGKRWAGPIPRGRPRDRSKDSPYPQGREPATMFPVAFHLLWTSCSPWSLDKEETHGPGVAMTSWISSLTLGLGEVLVVLAKAWVHVAWTKEVIGLLCQFQLLFNKYLSPLLIPETERLPAP